MNIGFGIAFTYRYPNGGPVLVVRLVELLDADMPTVLDYYRSRFGTPEITQYETTCPTSIHKAAA